MESWKSLLRADPIDWLLEESNPSVRYFTLRWLLDRPVDDQEVVSASRSIAGSEPVRRLLSQQKPEGYWGTDTRSHHGTQARLLLLMWLGYRGDEGVKRAMDYRLNGCLRADGAYFIEYNGRTIELPCHGSILLGQMLWFGYQEDPRARKLLHWLVQGQGQDGVWPCVSKARPFPCLWATADVLRAYQDLPAEWRTSPVIRSQRMAVERFLDSGLYHYGKSPTNPRWLKFGYPLRFDTDILEVLELTAPFVSPGDERIQPGLGLVLEKQDNKGRWPCEKHPQGGAWMNKFMEFEEIGGPSKWVTLHALKMLRALYSQKGDQ